MEVTLSGSLLKLTFAYDKATVERVKTISGATWDKDAKAWFVPIAALPTLEDLFGHTASFDYAAFVAYDEARRRAAGQLHKLLRNSGATFSVDANVRVHVAGECVSPLVQEVVAERSQWIAPFVDVASAKKEPRREWELTDVTRADELLAKSIAGAVAAEERKKQHQRQRWQQKPKQPGLFEGK